MIALSRRRKLFGGVFCIVTAAWVTDMLTGQSGPGEAGATPSAGLAGAAAGKVMPAPDDLDELIRSLGNTDRGWAPLPVDQVGRDLFVPTRSMIASLRPTELAAPAGAEEGEGPKPLPFDACHELQGILTGRVPLALIDGQLYRRGTVIDGHRLTEIHRDYVILRGDGTPVVLRISAAKGR